MQIRQATSRTRERAHHPVIRAFATLAFYDGITEWWTVKSEEKAYQFRDLIPFTNLYANDGRGGFIVYLDKPRASAP